MKKIIQYVRRRPISCTFCNKPIQNIFQYEEHIQTHTREKSYFCKFCPKEFTNNSNLNRHVLMHAKCEITKPTKCVICGISFITIHEFEAHMKKHFGDKPFKCETCSKSFDTMLKLRYHCKTHNPVKSFQCEQCQKVFTRKSSLTFHNKNIHEDSGKNKRKCPFCKKLVNKGSLSAHMRIHTGEKPFKCDHCKKSFSHKKNLNYHVQTKHFGIRRPPPEISLECLICEKQFQTNHLLRQHMYIHTEERPYFCRICHLEVRSFGSLNYHEGLHRGDHTKKNFKCSLCNHSYKAIDSLKQHMEAVHSKGRQFKCNICENTFKAKNYLKRHIKNHSDTRRYVCNQCGKEVKSPIYLKIHIETVHEKKKPYECTLCHKKFGQKPNLVEHTRTHTGERLHVCKICKKSYTSSTGLKYHAAVHANLAEEDMVRCPVCEKLCKSDLYLRSHMKSHTEGRFKCPTCNKDFHQANSLSVHMKKHRKQETISSVLHKDVDILVEL